MTEDILQQLRAERETAHARALREAEVLRAERDAALLELLSFKAHYNNDTALLANRVLELKAELGAVLKRQPSAAGIREVIAVAVSAVREDEREQCAREAEQSVSPEAAARNIRARAHLGVKTSP